MIQGLIECFSSLMNIFIKSQYIFLVLVRQVIILFLSVNIYLPLTSVVRVLCLIMWFQLSCPVYSFHLIYCSAIHSIVLYFPVAIICKKKNCIFSYFLLFSSDFFFPHKSLLPFSHTSFLLLCTFISLHHLISLRSLLVPWAVHSSLSTFLLASITTINSEIRYSILINSCFLAICHPLKVQTVL